MGEEVQYGNKKGRDDSPYLKNCGAVILRIGSG